MSTAAVTYTTPTTPITRRVRAYFAPGESRGRSADGLRPLGERELQPRLAACTVDRPGLDHQLHPQVGERDQRAECGKSRRSAGADARAHRRDPLVPLSDLAQIVDGLVSRLGAHESARSSRGRYPKRLRQQRRYRRGSDGGVDGDFPQDRPRKPERLCGRANGGRRLRLRGADGICRQRSERRIRAKRGQREQRSGLHPESELQRRPGLRSYVDGPDARATAVGRCSPRAE